MIDRIVVVIACLSAVAIAYQHQPQPAQVCAPACTKPTCVLT